jgi:plasmid maintenance system antidote protein VapI
MQKFLAAVFHLARPAVRRILGAVIDAAQDQALEEATAFAKSQEGWSAEQRRAAIQTATQAVESLRAQISARLGS